MRTPEQAAKTARRRNAKRDRKAPLLAFAGMVEHVTADDILEEERTFTAYFRRVRYAGWRKAAALRKQARAVLSPAEFKELNDWCRDTYPRDDWSYPSEFWRDVLGGKRLNDYLHPRMLSPKDVAWLWDER